MSASAYVVRSYGAALGHIGTFVLSIGLFVAVSYWVGPHHFLLWPFVALALGIAAVGAWRAATRLRVDVEGIALAYPRSRDRSLPTVRRVPWSSVHVLHVDPTFETVRVVLRSDAPMPGWITGRIVDPRDPGSGGSYEREVPGVDAVALDLAVRTLAPHVDVVTESAPRFPPVVE